MGQETGSVVHHAPRHHPKTRLKENGKTSFCLGAMTWCSVHWPFSLLAPVLCFRQKFMWKDNEANAGGKFHHI